MSLTFTSIFWLAQPLMNLVDNFFGYASETVFQTMGYTWYSDLIANGLIAGLGSVLVFVPQIIILFMILGLLEDTGYLARGAMLIDKPLSKIGLKRTIFCPDALRFCLCYSGNACDKNNSEQKRKITYDFYYSLNELQCQITSLCTFNSIYNPTWKPWLGGLFYPPFIYLVLSVQWLLLD